MYVKPTENPPAYKSVGYTSRTSSMTVDFCCIATSFVVCLFVSLPDFRGHKGFGRFGSIATIWYASGGPPTENRSEPDYDHLLRGSNPTFTFGIRRVGR